MGNARAPFIIDTGDLGSGSLRAKLFAYLEAEGKLNVTGIAPAATANGVHEIKNGRVESLSLGPFDHKDIAFTESPMSALGLAYWARYCVTMDLPNRTLYLAKGERYDEWLPPNVVGLNAWRVDGRLVVRSVEEGKVASRAGIQSGDVILTIQDTPAKDYELFTLYRIVLKQQGKRINMTIRRGDETIAVSFVIEFPPRTATTSAPATAPAQP